MTTAPARPLPTHAQALLATTAAHWGLAMRGGATPLRRRQPVPAAAAARQPWPYWPAYPGAAVGWR
jgi:hypothetical protein